MTTELTHAFREVMRHLVNADAAAMAARSRLHCHTRNVHSVVLLDSPGKTIRLFVANPDHELHRNRPMNFDSGLSVGFHAHHCDLTLICTRGMFTNWSVSHGGIFEVTEYAYRSALRGEKPGFEAVGRTSMDTRSLYTIEAGDSLRLSANEIHTVSAPAGDWAAWLVLEGEEDPAYRPVCYSNTDLSKEDMSQLYQPMSEDCMKDLLTKARIL